MKKITLLFLFISTLSFAQIKKIDNSASTASNDVEIGKIQPLGQPVHMDCKKSGNKYTFSYRDAEYKTIDKYREFSFEDVDNAFEDLYKTIMDGFEKKQEDSISLELKDYFVTLKFEKSFGMLLLKFNSLDRKDTVGHNITSSNTFTKKQIEKLFGKK